jgi:hypothetical protein
MPDHVKTTVNVQHKVALCAGSTFSVPRCCRELYGQLRAPALKETVYESY